MTKEQCGSCDYLLGSGFDLECDYTEEPIENIARCPYSGEENS